MKNDIMPRPKLPIKYNAKIQYKSPFSPYNLAYFCPRCQEWIFKQLAKRGKNGAPLCPICRAPLRTKPRNKKR